MFLANWLVREMYFRIFSPNAWAQEGPMPEVLQSCGFKWSLTFLTGANLLAWEEDFYFFQFQNSYFKLFLANSLFEPFETSKEVFLGLGTSLI